jgi:Ca2+-binding EF-hand superfamily protein
MALNKEEVKEIVEKNMKKYEKLLKAFEVYDETGKIIEGLKVLKGVK